jgi:hypothetical protein
MPDQERQNASTVGRRHFLKSTAAGLLGALAGSSAAWASDVPTAASFQSRWPQDVTRFWAGPDYWANPLSAWRVANGRLEFVDGAHGRSLHHLTRQIRPKDGALDLRVRASFVTDRPAQAGFEVGAQGPLGGYRNNAVNGRGLPAGLASDGRLFIGDRSTSLDRAPESAALHLTAAPNDGSGYTLALSALDADTGEELGELQRTGVPAERLVGNVALHARVRDGDNANWGDAHIWFRAWEGRGDKLTAHPERALGPILFAQHTLSRNVLKMTAQLAPTSDEADDTARLRIRQDGRWQTVAEADVHDLARTATFRVEDWDAARDVPYRVTYGYQTAGGRQMDRYEGAVRREPIDQDTLVVAGLSCAKDTGFPNEDIVSGLRHHDPDVLAFTGDQYYEETGGYVRRAEDNTQLAMLDVLHRWYEFGWSFGDLMRERPSICLLDDHDVFHANIWGEGGETIDRYGRIADGGFYMPPEWINAIQRAQTAHLPDPHDATPVGAGISVYYTDMLYGRVSFALLEDRKWKTGPLDVVETEPDTPDDWIVDPNFDPEDADRPELTLMGERQLDFLDDWATDWRGADMKTVISQTSLAQLPTHHGPRFKRLVADLDSNGWPQTPRDEALRRMRKGFSFHLGGDQHLPMMLRYGIDDWNDAPYNFCVPAVAVGWTRAFWPGEGDTYEPDRYEDGFDNKMTVYAVANPERNFRRKPPLAELSDKSSGYGIVRFHKPSRKITMEAWPILSDPSDDDAQYDGWPKTVAMRDNYARDAAAHLPEVRVEGASDPMIQVIDAENDETLYTLRIRGQTFRPKVFREGGRYAVSVGDDAGWRRTFEGVRPAPDDERDALTARL